MRCRDCHNFVLFSPVKGLCLLAKEFLTRDEFTDPRVACDFWKPYRMETVMIDGELKYQKVKNPNVNDRDPEADNDNLHDDDAEERSE